MEYLKTLLYFDYYDNSIWRAGLDILIVSIIIYLSYKVLHKTRGMQLIVGVALFWLLGFVASYFELELLDWVVTNIRPAIIFVVIILLQPEIRRMFGEMSKLKLAKFFFFKPTYQIDEIVEAAKIMAQSKTGSIIVIAREISLKDIIEQSVQLDSLISISLLLTIFKKNSALHDGAVIIEQNRVASASSYLPMSSALGTSTMGARHRSALGLAEETDAIILVTSEETGEISLCKDGEMVHPVKPFELKTQLLNFLYDEEKKAEKP